jgi:hypothetical protein
MSLRYILELLEVIILKKVLQSNVFDILTGTMKVNIFVKYLLPPSIILFKCLIVSVVLWLIISIFYKKKFFHKIFILNLYGYFIFLLGLVLSIFILILKNQSPYLNKDDLQILFGLNIFIKSSNILINTFLNEINIISIWWMIYMIFGVSSLTKVSKKICSMIVIGSFFSWVLIEISITSLIVQLINNLK